MNQSLPLLTLTALMALMGAANGALHINVGRSSTGGSETLVQDNQGPTGSDTNYQAFNGGAHETATTGNLQTFTATTFAGAAGTYDVGVTFTWPDTSNNNVKQAFGRSSSSYGNFYDTWMGADARTGSGGNGAGADTTTRLTLTGLPTNTTFTLTSYHFDSNDQTGSFTTNRSGATSFDIGANTDPGTPNLPDFAYDFTISSDGSGLASIDYQMRDGGGQNNFFLISGFDLVAIPEPSSVSLFALAGIALVLRRRRCRE